MKNRRQVLLDCVLLFLFAAMLIRPLFKASYTDKWGSIESTFIADARFLIEHWPHPKWQPLWYAGTRFDYIYPPAIRYGTAVVSKVTGFLPVRAYHVYTAFFYCVGIAGVYFLIRAGTGSRGGAVLGAAAAATMSPAFLLMKQYRDDAWKLLPLRLGVLVKYGEGPHMTALALIPFALAFSWMALDRRRPWAIVLAAMANAAVVSTNFYGATALAIFYPVLVWSFWITRRDTSILLPAAAIPVLSYGLTAFWLVPSYIKVTSENLKFVALPGNTWSIWMALLTAIVFVLATDKFARKRPERTWTVFVAGSALLFSLNVLGNYFFGFLVTGDPHRLIPELDLIYIMAGVTVLLWMWRMPGPLPRGRGSATAALAGNPLPSRDRLASPSAGASEGAVSSSTPRVIAVGGVMLAFATTAGYIRHAWEMFPLWPDYTNRVEYKVPEWLWKNMPDARVLPVGSVRFWFNAWRNLKQLGGGSEQGLLNPLVQNAQWEINMGDKPAPAILWMQALAVDAVYVSDQRSQEVFREVRFPEKYNGVLPAMYDDREGNRIYRVPRRYPARARVVETARLDPLQPPRFNDDLQYLGAYVDVIERGPDSEPSLERNGTDAMTIRAKLASGQSLLVQESYDRAWKAWSGERQLTVRKDAFGMMVIDAPPGEHEIHLEFTTPLENQVGKVLTGVTVLALIAMVVRRGQSLYTTSPRVRSS